MQDQIRTRACLRPTRLTALCSAATLTLLGSATSSFGLVITPTYAANINSDANATTIKNGIQSAINEYQSRYSDPITVNITFQEGGGLGSSSTAIVQFSYPTLRAAMVSDATSADDAFGRAGIHARPRTGRHDDRTHHAWRWLLLAPRASVELEPVALCEQLVLPSVAHLAHRDADHLLESIARPFQSS